LTAKTPSIAWYLGFGWPSVITVLLCGAGINLLNGPLASALYVPFLIVALYMTVRFRLFNAQPWRRVHSRAMLAYGRLAEEEYEAAKNEQREYDIAVPCRGLADHLFGPGNAEASSLLLDENRKNYYKKLAREHPRAFLTGIDEKRHDAVLEGVMRDIDASRLGPDILIAKAIAMKHSPGEAANYLHALMLGKVR